MSFLYPSNVIDLAMEDMATLTVADAKDQMTVPADMELYYVRATIGDTGTTSGNNDFVVEYTPPGGSAADLWTVGAGVGRIAYNASARFLQFDRDSLATTTLKAGGTLKLNVDAVAGAGTPARLVVHLIGVPLDD